MSCWCVCRIQLADTVDGWWLWLLGKLVPKAHTIKWQMLESFSVLILLSIGLTYMICLSSIYALGSSTFAFGQRAVLNLVNDDLTATASSVGMTVNKTLSIISESIVMSSAVYSYSLVNYNSLVMKTQSSYNEYNFKNLVACSTAGQVPSDFSVLSTMSGGRFPSIANFECGSLDHSSVYLASRTTSTQIDRVSTSNGWTALSATDARIQKVIDLLAVQDIDLKESYSKGPKESVMFYNSAILCPAGTSICDYTASSYTAIHRTYPGIYKDLPSGTTDTYDPPARSWFKKAPRSGVYLYGPYKESFTGQFVLTVSSRAPAPVTTYYSTSSDTEQLQMVSAAVLLLDSIRTVVSSIEYPKSGFGALLINSGGVWSPVVWRPGTSTEYLYDATIDNGPGTTPGAFKPLSAIDAKLAAALGANSLSSSKTFQYADPDGVEWMVSAVPFFPSTDATTGKQKLALVMLVFAKHVEVVASIRSLQSNIDKTTVSVLHTVLILAFSAAGFISIVVYCTLAHSLAPLRSIIDVSRSVIQVAAEEEATKDYSAIVNSAFSSQQVNRRDEVGVLAANFFQLVCLLHNNTVAKRRKPKYPVNPFHLAKGEPGEGEAQTACLPFSSWQEFYAAWRERQDASLQSNCSATAVLPSDAVEVCADSESQPRQSQQPETHLDDLDVLGSMMAKEGSEPMASTLTVPSAPAFAPASAATRGSYEAVAIEVVQQSEEDRGVELTSRRANKYWQHPHQQAQQPHNYIAADLDVAVPVQEAPPKLKAWQSIRVRVVILCGIMFSALLAVMVVTVVTLQREGVYWMDVTTKDIVASEHLQVDTLSTLKSLFTLAYFQQITLNMAVYTATAWRVLDSINGNLIKTTISSDTTEGTSWLRSYSLQYDSATQRYDGISGCPLDATTCSSCVASEYSGYFTSADATGLSSNTCPNKISIYSKQTSLLDFKSRSLFYRGSVLSNMGLGLPASNSAGFYRQFPYKQSNLNNPTSCNVESTNEAQCQTYYAQCSSAAAAGGVNYPPWFSPCRNWYQLAAAQSTPSTDVLFMYPRISGLSNNYVVTAVSALYAGGTSAGALNGAVFFNVLVADLISAINAATIMQNGYVYVIDSKNTTRIIVHPKAPRGATSILQGESFTASEFAAFQASVLDPISAKANNANGGSVSAEYSKQGRRWYLHAVPFSVGTVHYTAIGTVPYSDLTKAADDIAATITATINGMIAAYTISMVIVSFVMLSFSRAVARRSLDTFQDLQIVCNAITEDRLGDVAISPAMATSSDLRVLLEAFSNLIIALRFGSDTFARDDVALLKATFEQALDLYTATGNTRGMGAACNNLGYVNMNYGQFDKAEELFKRAVANAESLVEQAQASNKDKDKGKDKDKKDKDKDKDSKRLSRAQRLLSDRRGNLAVLYLEKAASLLANKPSHAHPAAAAAAAAAGESARAMSGSCFAEAFKLLEGGLLQDKQLGYLRGVVVKQGSLGQFYSRQGEFAEARRICSSCLQFIQRRQFPALSGAEGGGLQWEDSEIAAAEQVALLNMAMLRVAETSAEAKTTSGGSKGGGKPPPSKAASSCEAELLEALTRTQWMDPAATRRAIAALHADLLSSDRPADAAQLLEVAVAEGFGGIAGQGSSSAVGHASSKKVAVVVDYSGSMSGTKINAAMDNLLTIFDENIRDEDSLVVFYFDGSACHELFPMMPKSQGFWIRNSLDKLRYPSGGTNLYDSVWVARQAMAASSSGGAGGGNEFIIVLTDGQDGSSKLSLPSLIDLLRGPPRPCPPLIVIGVGGDVQEAVLRSIAEASGPKGMYIFCEGNKEGIRQAFSTVASVISSQVVLEDL